MILCCVFASIARHHQTDAFAGIPEPSSCDSNFGRQEYWNDFYKQHQSSDSSSFSWYSGWNDLEPFVKELIAPARKDESRILIPGVGNDADTIVGMYDAGYTNLVAFDYAPEGIECTRRLLGRDRTGSVELLVADARNMPFDSMTFDAILEKGTLDAIYLSGGRRDKNNLSKKHLDMAVREMARVLKPGGIMMSVTAACVDKVQASFAEHSSDWLQLRDGSFHITEDGFTSNNVDGVILAWKRAEL
jgi:SAM-dependent methyltransferase